MLSLVRLHGIFLLLIFSFLGIKTALTFDMDWDFLAYHLPFSLMHFHMTTFELNRFLQEAYKGFPPLVHIVQGLFIRATGIMSAGSLANMLMLGLLVVCLKVVLRENIRWFLTFCLAIPLFVIHYSSHYIDFWVAGSVVIVFAAALKIFEEGFNRRTSFSLLFGIFLGMYSKYQAWPFIVTIVTVLFVQRLWIERKGVFKNRTYLWFLLTGMLVVSYPVKNIIEFGNPTYPVPAPIIHSLFPQSPPEFSQDELKPIMPSYLWDASRPRRFFESALELNRFRGPNYFYSVDQSSAGGPTNPHFRMGGWFLPTVIGIVFSLIILWRKLDRRLPIALLGLLVGILLFIPQNHELRYWLFVPVCGLYIIARDFDKLTTPWQVGIKTFFVLCSLYVFSQTSDRYTGSTVKLEQVIPGAAREFWSRQNMMNTQETCINVDIPYGIFWAGPTFNEYSVKYCDLAY